MVSIPYSSPRIMGFTGYQILVSQIIHCKGKSGYLLSSPTVSQDASKAYQLHCEVLSIRQNSGTIIQYFGKLCKLWQEYDVIDDCIMECPTDIGRYTSKVNSQRVYAFLAGLDSYLDGIRSRVLSTVPLPNLQTTYAMICAEANRNDAMMGKQHSLDKRRYGAAEIYLTDLKKGGQM
ncbi:hypothetical protein IFM89_033138 [Coptis chinensis]|uniref:Retrotransposon gag domain-containing protein n=1 Tax=Coptis chinensis TaxID=261450 RepID=A0A835HEC4_9MAGN|nr:hypothetical protein IFM89_033138 [Coptis chinensis]